MPRMIAQAAMVGTSKKRDRAKFPRAIAEWNPQGPEVRHYVDVVCVLVRLRGHIGVRGKDPAYIRSAQA